MVWLYRAAIPVGRGHLFLTQGDYYLSPRLLNEGDRSKSLILVPDSGEQGACLMVPDPKYKSDLIHDIKSN
jgi:hypothetical protein